MKSLAQKHLNRPYRLGELLLEAGIISPEALSQCLQLATSSRLPLGRILLMGERLKESELGSVLKLQSKLRQGAIDRSVVMAVLRSAKKQGISIEEALRFEGAGRASKYNSRIARLLFAASIVNEEEMEQAERLRYKNRYPTLGLALVAIKALDETTLLNAINLHLLVKSKKINLPDASRALEMCNLERIDFDEALSRLDIRYPYDFAQNRPRLGQLLVASGLLDKTDAIVILELSSECDRAFGELLIEHELTSSSIVEAALALQNMFSLPDMSMDRAIRLLQMVEATGMTLERLLEESDLLDQASTLLLTAGIVEDEILLEAASSVEKGACIGIGEYLLSKAKVDIQVMELAIDCMKNICDGTMPYERALASLAVTRDELVSAQERFEAA